MGEFFRVVRRAAARAVRVYFAPITWTVSRALALWKPSEPGRPAHITGPAVDRPA